MKNTTIKTLLHAFLIGISLLSLNTLAGIKITYIHNDALGTPVAGTDEQGNVKWRAHYQPYGEELLGERQLFGVRTGYTGHRDDPETGLTYMGARYYSPTIGRFMGVDPAGVSESNIYSFNRYAYANNNPYRFVDPNGESPVSTGLVLIARETGIGFGLGVIADSISQYAAFGEVDIQLALTSNAAIAGGEAGLLSGVVRSLVSGIAVTKSGVGGLLKAGQQLDRNGLTKAGRALQKHGDRSGSVFPKSTGNAAARNQQGQDILEGILKSGNQTSKSNRFGGKDIFDNNTGRGVRFDADRNMKGFLEP